LADFETVVGDAVSVFAVLNVVDSAAASVAAVSFFGFGAGAGGGLFPAVGETPMHSAHINIKQIL